MQREQILIVGAGPAGCAAAYDLAEAGKQVLLLDRRTFPRHKACACGLTRKTLTALRYSVQPILEQACREIVLEPPTQGDGGRQKKLTLRDREPIAAMAVRERFDAFCLGKTLAAGKNGGVVKLRKIETVLALRETSAGVEIDLQLADGLETVRGPVLVGADGSNGQTRRLATALHQADAQQTGVVAEPGWYTRGFALEATVPYEEVSAELPEGDRPHDLLFDFSPVPGGYGWLFPKGDHINIGVGAFTPTVAGATDLKRVTRALLAEYTQRKLGVALHASATHVSGQHLGMGGQTYRPRGRVLLVGDAAGLVDPLTGEGIHSAIVSGQAAASAILAGGNLHAEVAAGYAARLQPLQATLTFSQRAAQAFYREPARGFKVMQTPLVGRLVLKTYTDGLPVRWVRPLVRMAARYWR